MVLNILPTFSLADESQEEPLEETEFDSTLTTELVKTMGLNPPAKSGEEIDQDGTSGPAIKQMNLDPDDTSGPAIEVTKLMLPEDKKLVGYNQESDKAWVLRRADIKDELYKKYDSDEFGYQYKTIYGYIKKLKEGHGYTERELLYMYPAADSLTPGGLSVEIKYYTDQDMTRLTTVDDGAKSYGSVPDVVGTYYRKAEYPGGNYIHGALSKEEVTYTSASAISPFYVVDKLEGGTRRGFALSLVQPNYKTPNGVPRGVDQAFASVDEGWSWDPAKEGKPAKLTLKDYHQDFQWMGIPIAQRAEAFTKAGGGMGGTGSLLNSVVEQWTTNTGGVEHKITLLKQYALYKSLNRKNYQLGGSVFLPGFEQVEIDLHGNNKIKSDSVGKGVKIDSNIYVLNYELAPLDKLFSLIATEGGIKYEKNPEINILGMEDKRLLLTGEGTLNMDGSIRSPAGLSVGKNVTLDVDGSLQTMLLEIEDKSEEFLSRNKAESRWEKYTYEGSDKNPGDISIDIEGRVNIKYDGNYGIYSTGKFTANKANLTIENKSNSSKSIGAAGIGAANGMEIKNSRVEVRGLEGSTASAISAANRLNIIDSTLTTSGYDYGLSVFGLYQDDDNPASLELSGGDTQISANKVALYASDNVNAQITPNKDGVSVSIENLFGSISGGNQAVYAYTNKVIDEGLDPGPVRTLDFSTSNRANTVRPYGLVTGTFEDEDKTIATLLENSSGGKTVAKAVSASYISYTSSSNNKKPIEEIKPVEMLEIDFVDVNKKNWYYDQVQYVAQRKLLRGITDTEFAPNLPMDRAMMITVLYRIAGEPPVTPLIGEMEFKDVDPSAYYGDPLVWAYQNNIAQGRAEGIFDPNKGIKRQDLAVFLYRYAKPSVKSTSDLYSFIDFEDVEDYAELAMKWAVTSGIIQGDGQKRLNPNDLATRAQCAAMIQRYEELKLKA